MMTTAPIYSLTSEPAHAEAAAWASFSAAKDTSEFCGSWLAIVYMQIERVGGAGVVERGGLHVILTEYHDSRRVDRQFFGRCARQGDPGSCEAIVSLEDEIYTVYAPLPTRLVK